MKKPILIELKQDDIYDILRLSNFAYSYDEIFTNRISYSDLVSWLLCGSKLWGLKTHNKLVAISALTFYNADGDMTNYTQATVAVLTTALVHPYYRGLGFQKTLINKRIEFALSNQIYNIHSLVDVSNIYSLKNLTRSGFINRGKYSNDQSGVVRLVYNNHYYINIYKIINYFKRF